MAINLVIPVGSTGISITMSAWLIPEIGLASGSDANMIVIDLTSAPEQASPVIKLLGVSSLFIMLIPLLIIISLFHQMINMMTKTNTVAPVIISNLFKLSLKN